MNSFETIRNQAISKWGALVNSDEPVIYIGTASCGRAAGALQVLETIQKTLQDLQMKARVVQVGCLGPCYLEPLMDIALPGTPRVSYAKVTPHKAAHILRSVLIHGNLLPTMAVGHFGDKAFTAETDIPRFFDLPMLKSQVRIILRNCGMIDAEDIDHYLANDGYLGLQKALEIGPVGVIAELKASGLRGRGGAGYPAFQKWELCRTNNRHPKYVICNADEGDPGAFMNRSLIEGDPHSVLEGILIAGYTIGAQEGFVYVRAEYPLAVIRLKNAVRQMRAYGLLGKDILGSGVDFDISIKEGAGAFVCGEESALIASLEGERGMPRPRPPYPTDSGLRGSPTLINNTETFGILPNILRNGGKWFQGFGVKGNTGTKTFSLVGKARHTGLIEVPLGTTLRQVVYDIGGGTEKPFKAVQTGGPMGGCLSPAQLDIPIDYESMRANGSLMGSGGLIVMDESTCLVDIARYFLSFSRGESCGKCTPCRIGTRIMVKTLDKIARGDGEPEDLEILLRVSNTMEKTSLCGSGQSAHNPVLSTLRNFLGEYKTHIHQKYCPAAVCTDLFNYSILPEKCNGCGLCVDACTERAIQGKRKEPHTLDVTLCIKCRTCVQTCHHDAIVGIPIESKTNTSALAEMILW